MRSHIWTCLKISCHMCVNFGSPAGLENHCLFCVLWQQCEPCKFLLFIGRECSRQFRSKDDLKRRWHEFRFSCFSYGSNALGNFVIKAVGVGTKFCTFLLFIGRECSRQFRYKGDLRRFWCEILYFSAFHKARMPSAISL